LENDVKRKKIKAGPGKQWVEGKNFRLAKEIKYNYRPTGRQNGSRDAELKRVCGWLSAELV
jgi:hypothetical protein